MGIIILETQICLPFCSLYTEWYTKLWFSVFLDLMFIAYARHLCLSSFIYFLPVGGNTSSSFCVPTDISKFSFRALRLLSARWHRGCISLLGLHRSTTGVVVYAAEMYFLTVLEATSHRWRYRWSWCLPCFPGLHSTLPVFLFYFPQWLSIIFFPFSLKVLTTVLRILHNVLILIYSLFNDALRCCIWDFSDCGQWAVQWQNKRLRKAG